MNDQTRWYRVQNVTFNHTEGVGNNSWGDSDRPKSIGSL